MLLLKCGVQNYDWGRDAESSEVIYRGLLRHGCSEGTTCHAHHADFQVAKLAIANGLAIDDTKPFAEFWCVARWQAGLGRKGLCMWWFRGQHLQADALTLTSQTCRMGTHPVCPSIVASTGETLERWIDEHPECLGLQVQQRFGGQLPFLFKVSRSILSRRLHWIA